MFSFVFGPTGNPTPAPALKPNLDEVLSPANAVSVDSILALTEYRPPPACAKKLGPTPAPKFIRSSGVKRMMLSEVVAGAVPVFQSVEPRASYEASMPHEVFGAMLRK